MSAADEARAEFVASNGYRVRRLADGQTKITRATVGAFEHVTWCGGDEYLAIAEHAEASRKVKVTDQIEAELAEWIDGGRSWSDQHHGLPNEIELTARADEATIRLLIAKLEARAALEAALGVTE